MQYTFISDFLIHNSSVELMYTPTTKYVLLGTITALSEYKSFFFMLTSRHSSGNLVINSMLNIAFSAPPKLFST